MKKKIFALILCLAVCISPTGFASAEELASPQISPPSEAIETEVGIEVGELVLEEELELSDLPDMPALYTNLEEDSETTSEIIEVSNLYDIKPMPEFKSTRSATAALPDISLGAIVIRGDQPYPSNANTKVEVGLNNVGSASATNVVVSLYLDGTLKGKFMIEGTLNPGDSGTFYCTANILGGTHTLKMIANEDRTITESNYTNNTKETTRTWADCIALSVDAFRPEDGSGDGVVRDPKVFEFAFANRGNITAHDVKLIYKVNGSTVKTSTMSVSPRKILSGTIPFTFLKYGKYKVEFFIEPDSSQTDITPNNDAKGYTVNMDYDVEVLTGRWANPKDLGVKIDASAKLFINRDDTLTLPMCKTSFFAWNGINSKASFGQIVETTLDTDKITTIAPKK
ncbi:CARDB domain-containing protein [Clostridium sp. D33t1_170424_F3]|uniref:CARDB domain-containing protein n=1 Tax=Clostridium sp. D33t1_170424_F3 TaxID=2787099 RepID=UPI0018AB7A42|nr:CARDB domain-containing protein [Clostridium sp. D33t1_170424_F3]